MYLITELWLFLIGKSWSDKIKDVRVKMENKNATAVVFDKLDDEACKYTGVSVALGLTLETLMKGKCSKC